MVHWPWETRKNSVNEVVTRIIVGLIAAPSFLWFVWMGGAWFFGLVLVMTLGIQTEVIHIARKAQLRPNTVFTYLAGFWVICTVFYPEIFWVGPLILVGLIVFETLSSHAKNVQRLFSTFFSGLFAPVSLAFFVLLRNSEPENVALAITFTMLMSIWGADVFAYFGGKLLGKNPLAPTLSPKKTWEGYISGLTVGTVFGMSLLMGGYHYFGEEFPLTIPTTIMIMFISGSLGTVGDLAESKLKRSAEVKDSGNLIPGHGGLFDRFDSLLITAPAVYAALHIVTLIK